MVRWIAMLALLTAGCGDEGAAVEGATTRESPTEEPTPAAGASAVPVPAPTHGGTVVGVGPYFMEVVAHGDGQVEVSVHPRSPDLPSGARVSMRLTGDDGAQHPLSLTWDPAQSRYRGRLYARRPDGDAVTAIPGPIAMTVTNGERVHRGRASTVVVTEPPDPPPVVRTPRNPTEPGEPAGEAAAAEAEVPVDVAAEVPAETATPPIRSTVVQVRPRVVARPLAGTNVASPTPVAPVERAPIVNRRARATGAAPERARPSGTEGATVGIRQ